MIVDMLQTTQFSLSCLDICKYLISEKKIPKHLQHYLPGSISSILNKLVKDRIIIYDSKTTPRGGHLYKYNPPNL